LARLDRDRTPALVCHCRPGCRRGLCRYLAAARRGAVAVAAETPMGEQENVFCFRPDGTNHEP
jgi:hypothetical protein